MSQRNDVENALRISEERLRMVLESARLGTWDCDFQTKEVFGDERTRKILGLSPGRVPFNQFLLTIHPEDRGSANACLLDALSSSGGELHHLEVRVVWPDGDVHWAAIDGRVRFESQGKERRPVGCIGTVRDITAAKNAEEALRAAYHRIETTLSSITDAFFALDKNWRFTYINSEAERLVHRPAEKLLGRNIWELFPEADAFRLEYERAFKTGQSVHFESFYGPTQRWSDVHAYPSAEGLSVYFRDITDRKQAETRLARDLEAMTRLQQVGSLFVRENDLQPVLEQIVDAAIAISRADFGNIQLVNLNSGLKIAAQCGFPQWYIDYWNEVTAGRGSCGSALAAGQRVIVSDVEQSPIFAGTPGLEMQRRAGVRAVQSTPVVGHGGKVLGMFSTHFKKPHAPDEHALKLLDLLAHQAADIIERAQAAHALRAAKEDLAHVNQDLEKMVRERTAKLKESIAELEGFSYSLVHDMRAPLRAMLGYAAILQLDAGPRLREGELDLLRRIDLAATRMDQLITDSLNYSKLLREELPLKSVDIGSLIRGMVETYPNLHPPQADVSVEIGHLFVRGNESALTRIFSNLLGNAVKFVAPGVKPRVRVCARAGPCPPGVSKRSPGCAFVWIEDNGIGIPKYAHEKIFGMFQRLHRPEEYPGTGVGLALVKKSLERTGGDIKLESEPGKGSRFCVQLPLANHESAEISLSA